MHGNFHERMETDMILTVDKDSLQRSIMIADSIISSKNVNTVLSNCLFNISRDSVEIVSTDNEIGIRTRLDGVADGEISLTANGKRFASILKELPKGEIVVDVNNSFQVNIKTRAKDIKARYTLVGTSKDDYPTVPFFAEENAVEISQSVLKDMLRKVIHAAAIDTIKPVFNGVYMVSEQKGKVTVVATDSRRLSMMTRNVENDVRLPEGVIIPLKTVNEIVRLLAGGMCSFSFFENQCFFKIGETDLISRIVEGQFPNYRQVIPKEQHITAVLETKRLIDSVRRAMVFTKEPANKIILTFGKDSLVVEAKTPDLGESSEEIAMESNAGEPLQVGINAQFLMDSLKEIDAYSVSIGLTGQMSPVTITPDGDPDCLSVVMPIQVKSS
jgi:DNA polymerase-3 subunit beta